MCERYCRILRLLDFICVPHVARVGKYQCCRAFPCFLHLFLTVSFIITTRCLTHHPHSLVAPARVPASSPTAGRSCSTPASVTCTYRTAAITASASFVRPTEPTCARSARWARATATSGFQVSAHILEYVKLHHHTDCSRKLRFFNSTFLAPAVKELVHQNFIRPSFYKSSLFTN